MQVAIGMDLQILALVGVFPYLVMINLTLIKLGGIAIEVVSGGDFAVTEGEYLIDDIQAIYATDVPGCTEPLHVILTQMQQWMMDHVMIVLM